jgi:ribosome biogenesis GTPase
VKHYDHEEDFHSRDKKQFRKERRVATQADRSKYKKTDQSRGEEKEEIAHHLDRGRIISISGEGSLVDFEGKQILCSLKGFLKKDTGKQKNLVAVGDWVRFTKEGAIVQVEERTSTLARTDISGRKEQLIAVNVDQVVISVSVIGPALKPSLIDRYLIAAEKGNIRPIIAINKIDLLETAGEEERDVYRNFLAAYEPLGLPILSVSALTGTGIEALRSLLKDKTTVFSGQSGVGKSSLLNACFGLQLKTGDLAQKTEKGSHTTTMASLMPLPGGGYCVDTPGIRSFGIWELTRRSIADHFTDIARFAAKCKFVDCSHVNETECAVLKAIEKKKLPSIRYESYLSLLAEIESGIEKTWS